MTAPNIHDSTRQERESYISEKFKCISNCDMCGLCKVFKGKSAEVVYTDYIEGIKSFEEVSSEYRGNHTT